MTIVRRRKSGRLISIIIVSGLTIVLAAQLSWIYWISPQMAIRRITLESDLKVTDRQLMEMISIEGETWASLDEGLLEARLESYPVIRRAQVIKVFPDTLKVFLYRRHPLVVAFSDSAEAGRPAVFDNEGYALQIGLDSNSVNLPILSGPKFSEPDLGARLPDDFMGVLTGLDTLRNEDPTIFALISEIEIIPRVNEGFDLKLYMNHVPIPILIDRQVTVESIRQAILVLDVLSSGSAGTVDEADMRGGHVVFHRTEES
ncbi:MAG: FtsQ-type POTRA domain-containing protein [Spirochaetaceae bacterium]|nr:FtsQ-type POTRA domain-containing protein [Spirochaetaceae bacterium]